MVKINGFMGLFFLIVFFMITSFHSCSQESRSLEYKSQAGQRLLYQLNKEGLSKNIIDIDGFKYYKIVITFSGDKEKYEEFLEKYNYLKVNSNYYCKDGNLIEIYNNDINTVLKYTYNSHQCSS